MVRIRPSALVLVALASSAAWGQEEIPGPRKGYVTNTGDGTITVVDLSTMTALGAPIVVTNTPRGGALSPDGRTMYIPNQHSETLMAIDVATDAVRAQPGVGGRPFRCAISPDGSKVYVACHTSNDVWQVLTADDTASQAAAFGNGGAQSVAVTLDGTKVCVGNNRSGDVDFFATADNAVVGPTTTVGAEPHAVAVTSDGRRFIVVGDGDTHIVDAKSGASIKVIPASGVHEEVRVVGGFAYATMYGDGGTVAPGIDVFDMRTLKLVRTIQLGGLGANGLDVSPDGTMAWVTMRDTNELREVDLVTGAETGRTLAVGSAPRSVTVAYLRNSVGVDGYVLPKKVKVAIRGGGQDSFAISGTYDDGGDGFNYAQEIDIRIEAQRYDLALTQRGDAYTYKDANVQVVLKPNQKGTSRGTFTIKGVRADLDTFADTNFDIRIGEDDGETANGTVRIAGGKFSLGKVRGTVLLPRYAPAKAKISANDGKADTVQVSGTFTGPGTLPTALGAVRFGVGALTRTIPGSSFKRSGAVWKYTQKGPGSSLAVVLDFAHEKFSAKTKGLEVGPLAGPTTDFVLDAGVDQGTVTVTVKVSANGVKRGY